MQRGTRLEFLASGWSAWVFVSVLWFATSCEAGDWPQILGPNRNGKAEGEKLIRWPATGPKLRWRHPVGSGFAGVAVAEGRAILFHRLEGECVAEALDARSGEQIWEQRFATRYASSISPDDGPRCVPLVHQGFVYLFGPSGDLHCLSFKDGAKRWSRDAYHDFSAAEGYFGAGSTPIVEGNKLLVDVGGKGAGVVAFALADGATVWKAVDDAASYSSPVAVTVDGARQVIFVTRLNVVSLDPENGKIRYQFPFGQRGPTVNAATPLVIGDHLFVSASYGVGAQWSKITAKSATKEWANDETMSSQYTTCIEHGGYLYGLDGRQDQGVARLRCFDPKTGKVAWTEEGFGVGALILADGKLLITKTSGGLVLVEPSPKAYRELAKTDLFGKSTTVQSLPALAGGLFYVRDTSTLKCLEVGVVPK